MAEFRRFCCGQNAAARAVAQNSKLVCATCRDLVAARMFGKSKGQRSQHVAGVAIKVNINMAHSLGPLDGDLCAGCSLSCSSGQIA